MFEAFLLGFAELNPFFKCRLDLLRMFLTITLVLQRSPLTKFTKPTDADLHKIESSCFFKFPITFRNALLSLGSSEIEDLYIHHTEAIYRFDEKNGKMSGFVTFASDVLGNYFAFDPNSDNPDEIYYYSHDPLGWAIVAPNFSYFLELFITADINTLAITELLVLNDC